MIYKALEVIYIFLARLSDEQTKVFQEVLAGLKNSFEDKQNHYTCTLHSSSPCIYYILIKMNSSGIVRIFELVFLLQDSLRQGSKILGVLSSEMCPQQVKMSAIWSDPYLLARATVFSPYIVFTIPTICCL